MVAHPATNQVADARATLEHYLSDKIEPRLVAMGFTVTQHTNPDPAGGPFLTTVRLEDVPGCALP